MKLKVLIDSRGERYLATESGEVLGQFGLDDNEWTEVTMKASPGLPTTVKVIIETAKIEYIGRTVDGSVVPSYALPEPLKALPAPAYDEGDDEPYLAFPVDFLWEEEYDEEDFMDGLCPDCVQELCLHCGQCKTPACEAENCDCP